MAAVASAPNMLMVVAKRSRGTCVLQRGCHRIAECELSLAGGNDVEGAEVLSAAALPAVVFITQ